MLLNHEWTNYLAPILNTPEFRDIKDILDYHRDDGIKIYPSDSDVFRAFDHFRPNQTKVIILGQDPYSDGKANGLAFSVNNGVKESPTLRNILMELDSDLGITKTNGDLTNWAKQGVLLLNTILTVEEGKPFSHSKLGWEKITQRIVYQLIKDIPDLIVVAWGKYAEKYLVCPMGSDMVHFISSSHPSPLSAHKGFFGSKPFSRINRLLEISGKKPIDWSK